MADGQLIVVTGIMAAGKSTVAQALAERFPRSAHVRGDHYRRSIVNGRERQRPKTGYVGFTPEQLDSVLQTTTPRLGYWLDSTGLGVEETVDLVLANLDSAARID